MGVILMKNTNTSLWFKMRISSILTRCADHFSKLSFENSTMLGGVVFQIQSV